MRIVTLNDLNELDESEYIAALESLYEYSPWVVNASAGARPFASIKALQVTLEGVIYAASRVEQDTLLIAHPDLAAKLEQIATLTDFSRAEQQRAGFAQLPKPQLDALREMLAAYRTKFGHPFILCVSEHDAFETIPILEARLRSTAESERIACLAQVARIGWYRLTQLITP